jgi:hypothetical protein
MFKVVNAELKSTEGVFVEVTQVQVCIGFFHGLENIDLFPDVFNLLGIRTTGHVVIVHSCNELLVVNVYTLSELGNV